MTPLEVTQLILILAAGPGIYRFACWFDAIQERRHNR